MLNVRIRNKRDTNNNFEQNDPVLLNGEIVVVDHETDGTKIKIGDGVNKYSSLPYFNPLYSEKPVYTYSEIQGLDEVISNLEAKIQLIPIIPSGVIMMWSGLEANIPDGYVLCNGQNGTPDLTDKFVIGAGSNYPIGESGGAKTHNHLYKVSYRPYYGALVGNDNDAIQAYDYESGNWTDSTQVSTGVTTRSNNGILQGQWSDATPLIQQTEGKSSVTSNMPPYYALCFIMKI